jgi:hypothetical protein
MAGSLGRAFVEVFADLSKFTPGLKQKIKAALDEQTKGIRFDELDKSAEKAGRSAADQLAKGVDSKIENNMFQSGKKGGTSLGKGMQSVVGGLSGLLLPALIAFGAQVAGALVPATTALAATIPAAIFTTVGAIAVLMIATNGVGEALKNAFDPARAEQFQKAMEKLAPAAQAFVREVQALGPAFSQLRKDVQQVFFVQLQGVLTRVATKLLPTLRTGLSQLSEDMGQLGAGILNAFGNGQEDIASIFIAAHEAIKPFIPAIGQLVSAFLTLGAVGGPMFAELSGGFAGLLAQFSAFIEQAAASGQLAGFFDVMLTVLQQIGAILGDVGSLFAGLLAAMGETGYESLGLLGQIVEQLSLFFNSTQGQDALIAAFTLVNAALETMFAIIGPLLPAIGELVEEFSGGLTDALKTVTPYLQGAAEWIGAHPDVLKAAVVAWGAYKLALIGVAIYQALVLATNPVGWIILAIAAIAAGAYLIYKNWDTIVKGLKVVWEAIKGFFLGIWDWVTRVGGAIGNWFTVTLPAFFASIPGRIWAALSALPGMLWNLFLSALNLAGQAIGIGIGLLIVAVVKLPGLIWDAIKAIGMFFVNLWNMAFALGKAVLLAGVAAVIWIFTELPLKIAGFVQRLPGIIGGAFRSAWAWAKREVREGADAIVDFVSKLPGRISGFMRNVGRDILSGLKAGINSVISGFNSGINRVGSAVGIGLPNIPLLASGGLITSPTLAIVGEAGKEAVIPMSNPARAEQVARETGLLAMLGSRAGHSEIPNVKVYLGTREITDILDVRIDKKLGDQANELAYGTR